MISGEKSNSSLFFVMKFCVKGYGTPWNIYEDDRILNYDYNHGFKNFKIYNIYPNNASIRFHKRDKK